LSVFHHAITSSAKKKADVVEYPDVFDRVGILVKEPPGTAGLPFI
jgi:hypothetical protein